MPSKVSISDKHMWHDIFFFVCMYEQEHDYTKSESELKFIEGWK